MTRRQRTLVLVFGGLVLCMLAAMGGFVLLTLRSIGTQPAAPVLTTLPPTQTPIPTWTPTPTPSPTAPPTMAPTPLPTATTPPTFLSLEDAGRLDQIAVQVADFRGLQPLRPVPRWMITREQLSTYYVEPLLDRGGEEQLVDLALVLNLFDMVGPNYDLVSAVKHGLPNSVAGFYDPESGGIYLVSDTGVIGLREEVVFAHEFGHALQDQHFGLLSLGFGEVGVSYDQLDRFNAVRALIEGDAELIEAWYWDSRISSEASTFPLAGLTFRPTVFESQRADYVAHTSIVDEVFRFPYLYGARFVRALYERGGWAAVDAAYADPPASTEQILHPARYRAGDRPLAVSIPALTDPLGAGWQPIFEDVVGEFMLRVYLQNQLDADAAARATEGWGGDLAVVYANDAAHEAVLVLHSVWETSLDAQEFLDAYVIYADRRHDHLANETVDAFSCWHGYNITCVGGEGNWVTLVIGPDRSTTAAVLAAVSE